ncbi:axoneme-associated protein mst101(2)-like [Ixodes scapularis]
MDLEQLRKPDLLLMCEELGIDARKIQRKPLLVKAIQALGADDKELSECWEMIKERREAEERRREAAKAKEEREAEERRREAAELKAKEEREAAVEMKRLELEMKRLEMNQAVRGVSNPGEVKALKIKDLMQPFKDKNPDTTQKAAELAEEFVARRSSQKDDTPERKFPGARGDYRGKYYKPRSEEDKREPKDSVRGAQGSKAAGGGEAGEENHRAEKQDDENDRLLEPYLHDLLVNGEPCKVLRDCAATLDVVHPSLVQADHYTAEPGPSWGLTSAATVAKAKSGLVPPTR